MKKGKIQIQAVLYKNAADQLIQSVHAIDCAARTASEHGWEVDLCWGDASAKPVFSEASWQEMEKICPHIQQKSCLFFNENTGYGRGNNLLARNTDAEYLLIMNPEILLPPGAILDLLAPFENPVVGLTEARQIPVEHPKYFDPKTFETEWSSGACFMIRNELFQSLGGFDEKSFFMYCEDVDLSWRVREAGFSLYYQPLAGVFHSRYLSKQGKNMPSITEQKYTILSEALLAYKWGYPDYARARINLAVVRGDPGAAEGQEVFRRMERMGTLPSFHDPEHRVAKIIQFPESGGMLFAPHRYQL